MTIKTIECVCTITPHERIEARDCPLHAALTRQAKLRMVHRDVPAPAVDHLDGEAARERLRVISEQLAAMKNDPAGSARAGLGEVERHDLIAEKTAIERRLGVIKEQEKAEKTRKHFAGLATPFYEACAAHLDAATLTALERDALDRLSKREQQSAARKAAKSTNGNGQQAK